MCSSKLKIYSVLLRNAKEVHNMEDLCSSLLLTFSLAPSLDVISEVRLRQAQTLLKPAPHSWQDKREAVGLAAWSCFWACHMMLLPGGYLSCWNNSSWFGCHWEKVKLSSVFERGCTNLLSRSFYLKRKWGVPAAGMSLKCPAYSQLDLHFCNQMYSLTCGENSSCTE